MAPRRVAPMAIIIIVTGKSGREDKAALFTEGDPVAVEATEGAIEEAIGVAIDEAIEEEETEGETGGATGGATGVATGGATGGIDAAEGSLQ